MATTTADFNPSEPEAEVAGITRVVMLAQVSGTRDGRDWPPVGAEIELPSQEAADLIRNHLAKPAPLPVEEKAIVPDETPERAVTARRKRRS